MPCSAEIFRKSFGPRTILVLMMTVMIRLQNVSVYMPVQGAFSGSESDNQLKPNLETHGSFFEETNGRVQVLPKSQYSYARGQKVVRALNDINLEFHAGEKIGIVGENGSGKSTLLRVLAGIYPPSVGSMFSEGAIVSFIDLMAGMDFEFTGRDNFYFRGLLYGFSLAELKSLEKGVCEYAGLGQFFYLPMKLYSTGMQMRLAFAIAIHVRGDVILLDEWLAVGDANFRSKASNSLISLVNQSQILILASNSEAFVETICDRIVRLKDGSVISDERRV